MKVCCHQDYKTLTYFFLWVGEHYGEDNNMSNATYCSTSLERLNLIKLFQLV